MKPRKGDYLVAFIVLAAALFTWFYPFLRGGASDRAVVTKDGVELCTLPLDKDTEFALDEATIQVKDGKIRILKSSCPDKVCVNTGGISKSGQSIVCVPNRIIIKIPYGDSGDADIIVS
ncbi:MAG: NusG domain II-containing protein [Clostridiales bacterium]|jgi:hypothetical protein|nr:NusG domain II-containing protein [Clostridiales bacterium]